MQQKHKMENIFNPCLQMQNKAEKKTDYLLDQYLEPASIFMNGHWYKDHESPYKELYSGIFYQKRRDLWWDCDF